MSRGALVHAEAQAFDTEFAVSIPGGLITPIITSVQRKNPCPPSSSEMKDLAKRGKGPQASAAGIIRAETIGRLQNLGMFWREGFWQRLLNSNRIAPTRCWCRHTASCHKRWCGCRGDNLCRSTRQPITRAVDGALALRN